MQNQEECGGADGADAVAVAASCEFEDWGSFGDEDILQQKSHISAEEAEKIPFVADKEPISALEAEYQSGSAILLEKIKILGEQYAAIRRTRGDGNCFFRSFMFSYLEHILDSQDRAEVNRIRSKVEECRKTLQSLGYTDFTFEDFFALFLEQLESVLQGNESSISHDELIIRSRDQSVSDYVVMFFRFVTSGEIQRRREFFEPFVMGLTNGTLEQFCKSAVEPMGEESDHVHITALSDALGVPIRVVYLDRSSCDTGGLSVNHHDFIPTASNLSNSTSGSTEPYITLLYRPGHYDILYPKVKASAGSASLPRCSLFLLVKHTVHGYLFKKWQDIVDGFLVALLGGQWRFNNPNVDIVLARCSQSNLSLTGPKGLSSSFRAVTYMVSKLSTCL